MRSTEGVNRQPVSIRPATLADLRDVVSLCQTQELANGGVVYTTAEKLAGEWEALGESVAEQVWAAVTGDNYIVACVELIRSDHVFSIRLWSLPDRSDIGLAHALLDKAEEQACAMGREDGGDSLTLFSQATSTRPELRHALAQFGFALLSAYEKMELALKDPPAAPGNLLGIEIRSFAAEQDVEPVYRADEEAFVDQRGHTPRTFGQWKQRLNFDTESFDPSVWLIASDGADIAGAALGEVINDVGWIHHLFVRRPWRRRGLGAALTLSILGSFYRRGVGAARLNVDAASLTNAHRL